MIKLDIINRVAEKTGVPKMKAEQAVDALFHSMKGALTPLLIDLKIVMA